MAKGFEVRGVHEEEVDKQVEHESEEHHAHHMHGHALTQNIALFTAILSTLGAVVSYQGGDTEDEAMLYKNEAVLQKSLASDQWNYYEAKTIKIQIAQIAAAQASPDKQEAYKQQIARYNQDKDKIKAIAEAYDKKSEDANKESESLMHPHHRLAESMTLVQIAIALASITVLTRIHWLFVLAGIAAAGSDWPVGMGLARGVDVAVYRLNYFKTIANNCLTLCPPFRGERSLWAFYCGLAISDFVRF